MSTRLLEGVGRLCAHLDRFQLAAVVGGDGAADVAVLGAHRPRVELRLRLRVEGRALPGRCGYGYRRRW